MYMNIHRLRRWKCCDATNPSAVGCCQKYHIPPDSDPVYDAIIFKMNKKDEEEAIELNERYIDIHSYIPISY
jgi:beta-galactosidase beta subunit